MTDETTARDRAAEVAEAEEWLRSVVSYPRRKRDVAPASAALAGLERLRALAGAPTADVASAARAVVRAVEENPIHHSVWTGTPLGAAIDELDRALAVAPEGVDAANELERLRHERECVLVALRAEGDPVRAASFVREAADSFAARVAELEAEPGGMDLEAQGEMADQLDGAQAAIGRVRAVCTSHIPPSAARYTSLLVVEEILRALDGDTTEEKR